MVEQFDLFAPVRRIGLMSQGDGPPLETKRAALASMRKHIGEQAERVLAYIESRGDRGATIEEIAAALEMRVASTCARVRELQGFGHDGIRSLPVRIRDAGTRPTSSARLAKVWVGTAGGKVGECQAG